MNPILFYDGNCGFCQQSVQIVLKYGRNHSLRFASLQGKVAAKLLPQNLIRNLDSVVVYQNGKVLTESEAVLFIMKRLTFPLNFLYIFKMIPASIRDRIYRLVAKNRYKITGTSKMCKIPEKNHRKRFLD